MGRRSLEVDEEPEPVSNTCVVFAKSEAMGLLRSGWTIEHVLAAYCSATARRVVSLLERIGMEERLLLPVALPKYRCGEAPENALGVKTLKPKHDTQLAGAIGAALFAKALAEKARN